ncbi:hypothetical protein MASR2M78_28300 [Treponema sp.]
MTILSLGAEERVGGEIVYAEGRDFSVVHKGIPRVYEVSGPDTLGLALEEGDLVQTGSKSFVEIQLFPRGSLLKLAENTSLLIRKIGVEQQEVSLDLVYGRVRAKVARLSGSESFSIRSLGAIAGVRGTDFGIDALIHPSMPNQIASTSKPLLRAYCFSGELAVQTPSSDLAKDKTQNPVELKANDMLTIDTSSSSVLIEKKSIEPSIISFWSMNEFKALPPLPAPESNPLLSSIETSSPASELEIRYREPDYSKYKKTISAKNFGISVSAFFSLVGISLNSVGVYAYSEGNTRAGTNAFALGTISVGLSFVSLIASYFVNTVSP